MAIGNPRSDQCHAAFIVLQQKGAHQSTGISSRLISRGRGGTNLTLLSSSSSVPSFHPSFLLLSSLSPATSLCVCVCIIHLSLFLRSNIVSPSVHRSFFFLASLPSLASSLLVARTRVLSIPLAVPDVVEATPAGGVAGGGADRDGRGPGAVVMKTYEIYSIWADAITPPPPPPTTDRPTILPHSLDPCTLAAPMCRVNRCW